MFRRRVILLLLSVFLSCSMTYAQQTVPASGGDAVGNGGTISYTIGQVVYTAITGSNGSLAQGIQQPYEISTLVGLEVTDIELELTTYPNPTNNLIHINIGNYDNETLSYQLYDIHGKYLIGRQIRENLTNVFLEEFSGSTFLLNVLEENRLISN